MLMWWIMLRWKRTAESFWSKTGDTLDALGGGTRIVRGHGKTFGWMAGVTRVFRHLCRMFAWKRPQLPVKQG